MELDITEAPAPVTEALGLLIADLGRWLCDLEERLERLEANANAVAGPR